MTRFVNTFFALKKTISCCAATAFALYILESTGAAWYTVRKHICKEDCYVYT